MNEFEIKDELELIRISTLERPPIAIISIISGYIFLKINILLSALSILPLIFLFLNSIYIDAVNCRRRFKWASKKNRISAGALLSMVESDKISKINIKYFGGFDVERLTPAAEAFDSGGNIYRVPFMWYSSIDIITHIRPDLISDK
ncbi:MAG TPA: hypothetical protein PKW98_01655 [Candidatus Wallbacteria bacterium]|nr:MAG: hypothetical protein BWY32_02297 [bacterium ADurb.Bin243]HOD39427.1 hypothetical protein [Candidatus Wallbacteria bacterium]HPG56497.1 hypothetical protein [Candidatus Wallbacteria bacterium]